MMIRRFALAMMLGIFTSISGVYGQLTFDVTEEIATGSTVDVDVVVSNFTLITVFEFGLSWDSTVVKFNSISDIRGDIDGFDISSLGTPPELDGGNLSGSFFNGNGGQNLDDGTVLFTMRFDVIGDDCEETGINFKPDPIYSDESFATLSLTGLNGSVMIDGADCGGTGGGTDLTADASEEIAENGDRVCVPITVRNFNGIVPGSALGSGQGDITWDPAIIEFVEISNNALPAQFSLNANNAATGSVRFVWFNFNVGTPFTLPDDATLFEVCYDVLGVAGQSSPVNLENWEWADDTNDNNDIPDVELDGSVTIQDGPVEQFMINVSDESASMGDDVCVDVTVGNFNSILGLEYRMQWDASVLSFGGIADDIRNENLSGLLDNNFSYVAPNNFITLSWNASSGIDVADGTRIYSICFDAIGDCETSSDVSIIPNGGSTIIVSKEENGTSSNLTAAEIAINNGEVDVTCVPTCAVTAVVGSCAGMLNGSISTTGTATGTCTWTNAAGQVVSNDCNLFGVGPGLYTLSTTFPDGQSCMLNNVEVPELPGPTIAGTTTDAGCGLGQINVTLTGAVSFSWDDPSIGQDLNPMVDTGSYTITAVGNNMCSSMMTFTVGDMVPTLAVNPTSVQPNCADSSDGSINLNITGGCEPYMISWTGGLTGANPMNVGNGTYTATITDDSGQEVMATVTLETTAITEGSAAVITNSTGSDGAITIDITGGAGGYNYAWTPTQPNTDMITGLAPGNYSVVVTDANGCMASFGPYNVPVVTGMDMITLTISQYGAGEFGVSCFESTDGTITANVNTDNLPGTLALSGDGVSETVTITTSGSTTFDMLGAGAYTVSYTNASGGVTTSETTITEPELFDFEMDSDDIGCENDDQMDGFIDIVTTGGEGTLTYDWMDPDFDGISSISNLEEGSYTVIVTDENGCDIMETFSIVPCTVIVDGCYEFPKIITPNGDARNDVFSADCLNDRPAELTVYNRWGSMVFNMPSYDGSWGGTGLSGQPLIEGGYMYVLDVNYGEGRRELVKGTVTILRN